MFLKVQRLKHPTAVHNVMGLILVEAQLDGPMHIDIESELSLQGLDRSLCGCVKFSTLSIKATIAISTTGTKMSCLL